MQYIQKIFENRNSLKYCLDSSLERSIIRTKSISKNSNPHEPDFIADLTQRWSKELFFMLSMFLGSTNDIKVKTVYCHQKPIVDINESKKPEIGDLLFVFQYTDARRTVTSNSLLLQAKKTKKIPLTISNNEKHQLKLYTSWPTFKYHRASSLNDTRRDIQPKCINTGAKYLLLHEGDNSYGCAIPNTILYSASSLSDDIINFLIFQTGRTYIDLKSTNVNNLDEWSKMINDLLEISFNAKATRKNYDSKKFPRLREYLTKYSSIPDLCCCKCECINYVSLDDGNDNTRLGQNETIDDSTGISVIFIEIGSRE